MEYKRILLIDFDKIVRPNNLVNLLNIIQPVQTNKKYNTGLILTIPKLQLDLLNQVEKGIGRVQYINTISFVENISEYAWFIYDRRKKVCEIMGIQGSLTKNMIDSVLSSIPNDVNVWIGISVENLNILDLIENYTSFGFKNPYMCRTSPLGYTFSTYGLCLLKINNISEQSSSHEALYVLYQFRRREEQNCKISLKLSPKTIEHLKQMSNIGSTVNNDNSISQKEIAGSFKLSKIVVDSVFSLEINKKSMISGEEQGVNIVNSLYNFHTHPVEAYSRNNVELGWPSSQDYIGFLASVKVNGTILHAIISVEGIYLVSIGNHWIDRVFDLDGPVKMFIKKEYNIKHKQGRDVEWYINHINSLSYEGFPIFFVQFFTWDDASTTFQVSFKRTYGNCFTRDKTLEKYKRLYF